ncbi:MAG: WXG100 family type VII secretion target [Lachnospiraceae bacterium]|nr:WXG100 family type VII secretion target [Lachnospiraceae bacterium]
MGDYLKVSKRAIERDAERIEKQIENVPAMIRDLQQGMQRLSGCWDGPAWAAYQQTITSDIEKLTEMYEHMKRYTIYMKEAALKYERTEQDICADIRSLYIF